MRRFRYALILLLLSAPVVLVARAQSVVSPKVNRAPVAEEATRVLLEDTRTTIDLPATDPDGDAVVVEIVTAPVHGTVKVEGTSVTYVPRRDWHGTDRFSYRAGDGTTHSEPAEVRVTVSPVNDAPVIVSEPVALRIVEGEPVYFRYAAVDVEGQDLSFRLVDGPDGLTLDRRSGEMAWAPAYDQAGTHVVRVAVSDGRLESVVSSSTLSVLEATVWEGAFSPFHVTEPVYSSATGTFRVTYIPELAVINIDGHFRDLSGDRSTADASQAAFLQDAEPLIPLELVEDAAAPGPRNGTFEYPSIGGTSLPTALLPILGINLAELITALDSGEIYVLVRSESQPTGELRAQLRPIATNSIPETAVLGVPSSVLIQGDPQSVALTANWTAAVDHEGDVTRQVFGLWAGSPLPSLHAFWLDSGTHSRSFTVEGLAGIYDALAGGGSGPVTVFPAVITTDGSGLSISDLATTTLTRGLVTAREESELVPDVFMLRGNFPNPFNPTTIVQFDLPAAAQVEVYVTDLLGRVVLTVPEQAMPAGLRRQIPIDASSLASGIYIYRVTARTDGTTHVATGTMTLLK